MSLSGRYWFGHPKPKLDELTSSYLIRLANANGMRVHSFCHQYWPHKQIWTRDIDTKMDDDIINLVSERAATSRKSVACCSLQRYSGQMFTQINPNGLTRWIRPIGVRHRSRTRYGLMWCPLCLLETPEVFKTVWRTNLSATCSSHGVVLLDRCAECYSPCSPHREKPDRCEVCGLMYEQGPTNIGSSRAQQFGFLLQHAAKSGDMSSIFGTEVCTIEGFDVLRQLIKILTSGARHRRLHKVVAKHYGFDLRPLCEERPKAVEYISSSDLHRIFEVMHGLLTGWPFMFVSLCAEADVWRSWTLKDFTPIHPLLANPSKAYLSPDIQACSRKARGI